MAHIAIPDGTPGNIEDTSIGKHGLYSHAASSSDRKREESDQDDFLSDEGEMAERDLLYSNICLFEAALKNSGWGWEDWARQGTSLFIPHKELDRALLDVDLRDLRESREDAEARGLGGPAEVAIPYLQRGDSVIGDYDLLQYLAMLNAQAIPPSPVVSPTRDSPHNLERRRRSKGTPSARPPQRDSFQSTQIPPPLGPEDIIKERLKRYMGGWTSEPRERLFRQVEKESRSPDYWEGYLKGMADQQLQTLEKQNTALEQNLKSVFKELGENSLKLGKQTECAMGQFKDISTSLARTSETLVAALLGIQKAEMSRPQESPRRPVLPPMTKVASVVAAPGTSLPGRTIAPKGINLNVTPENLPQGVEILRGLLLTPPSLKVANSLGVTPTLNPDVFTQDNAVALTAVAQAWCDCLPYSNLKDCEAELLRQGVPQKRLNQLKEEGKLFKGLVFKRCKTTKQITSVQFQEVWSAWQSTYTIQLSVMNQSTSQ